MRGTRLPVKRSAAVAFARVWARSEGLARHVFYHLEYPNGGGVPQPYPEVDYSRLPSQMDCVGAVFTILQCDRVRAAPWPFYFDKKLGYGYANCDTVIQDADGPQLLFESVGRKGEPDVEAGDIVVFGRGLLRHGHIGFLSGYGRVVHCSPSNSKKLGHALAETPADIFLNHKDRRYLRYRHWLPE